MEKTFPYTANIYCSDCTTPDATDLATVPGNPQEVILAQSGWMTLYNNAGVVDYVPNDGSAATLTRLLAASPSQGIGGRLRSAVHE